VKWTELDRDSFPFLCEMPKCAKKGARAAMRLMVNINGELLCPDCVAEHTRRTA
jgi:hypothetical protein